MDFPYAPSNLMNVLPGSNTSGHTEKDKICRDNQVQRNPTTKEWQVGIGDPDRWNSRESMAGILQHRKGSCIGVRCWKTSLQLEEISQGLQLLRLSPAAWASAELCPPLFGGETNQDSETGGRSRPSLCICRHSLKQKLVY